MVEYSVPLGDELERELQSLFDRVGPDGYLVKHTVGLVQGKLRAEVRANEHPPPHFHVTFDGEDASFSISDGLRLPGVHGLERYDAVIHVWWRRNQRKIALKWNNSRPAGCPVGPVPVPEPD
jgi:hypothetical protein